MPRRANHHASNIHESHLITKTNHPPVYRATNNPKSYSEASSASCSADSKSEKFTLAGTSAGNKSSRLLSRINRAACRSALRPLFLQGRKVAKEITRPEGESPPSIVRKAGLLRSFTNARPTFANQVTTLVPCSVALALVPQAWSSPLACSLHRQTTFPQRAPARGLSASRSA